MNGRIAWPVGLAAVALLAAACGTATAGPTNTPGTTKSSHPAVVSSPTPGTSTQPPAQTADKLQTISKLCLVSMPQLETLSTRIFNLAPKPSDQPSTSGVDTCVYGGKVMASGLETKFLSITVLANWSGMPNHFAAQPGFSNASAGVISVNGTSLVTAGAQITSGEQNGSWLILTVGNNGPPLVTWQALKATLSDAETQYAASNANPSSSPSASSGGNTGGSTAMPTSKACNLVTLSEISGFSGFAPINQWVNESTESNGSLYYACLWSHWSGGSVGQGSVTYTGGIQFTCGPSAVEGSVTVPNARYFKIGNTPVAIVLSMNSGNTGDASTGLDHAEIVAKAEGCH